MTSERERISSGAGIRTAGDPAPDPWAAYDTKLSAHRATLAAAERRDHRISDARLAVFGLLVLAGAVAFVLEPVPPALTAVPFALFVILIVLHERTVRRRDHARRTVALYEDGLRRLDGSWPGTGASGERFADPHHLHSGDLDLFGRGSLFERLCRARTSFGEETLARWLLEPAPPDEVRSRQRAVASLRERLDLREDVAVLGDAIGAGTEPGPLLAWTTARPVMPAGALPLGLTLIGATFVTTASAVVDVLPWAAVGVPLLLQGGLAMSLRERARRVLSGSDRVAGELSVIVALLARMERERFEDSWLDSVTGGLVNEGASPSEQVERLRTLIHRFHWTSNQLFLPVAYLLLWRTLHACALDRWRRRSGARLPAWLKAVGAFEALVSLSAYAWENPDDPFPELVEGDARIEGESLGHPLLPEGGVRNDVALGSPVRLYLISGSNMSGKSTFLRTVGVNAVLAQAGAPVRARRLLMTPLVVGGTLRILDSLSEGASRFYAEITRLRQLFDATERSPPLLFLVDELLQGTNSHDRRIGAGAILRELLDRGAIGLATTHDLALAEIAMELGARARNVHFADELENGRMVFDYRLREGVVQRSNAIDLMRAVGILPPGERGVRGT